MSSSPTPSARPGFDRAAAVTRSLLGWGVVAGPFYLIIGLAQALTRDGFKLSEYPLSLLMLGEHGWIQVVNLALTGLMVLAATLGFARVMHKRTVAVPLGIYGVCLLVSAAFPPDPVDGFPPGSVAPDPISTGGLVHFGAGAVGLISLAVAAALAGRWFTGLGERGMGADVLPGGRRPRRRIRRRAGTRIDHRGCRGLVAGRRSRIRLVASGVVARLSDRSSSGSRVSRALRISGRAVG